MKTKLEKRLIVIIMVLVMFLISAYVKVGGLHVLMPGETIRIGCIVDHLTWEDTGTEYISGYTVLTGKAECWINTTQ
ncbi:hypothetical protein LCGC14_1729000 [marine sediment metagenome]|uniref:Uncharacterized protein n=1 Tax=marine sediment metagenome TaxID=412755 RepID=A0A0F9JQQ7_9ZZZZ